MASSDESSEDEQLLQSKPRNSAKKYGGPCACVAAILGACVFGISKISSNASGAHNGHGTCVSGTAGPSCHTDGDCVMLKGCVRCAGSGHCTDIPLPGSGGSSSPRRRRSPSPESFPPLRYHSSFMSCPAGSICGILALETGRGSGNYKSSKPLVHGLWPQEAPYGNSVCLAPASQTKMSSLPTCMDPSWGFINHEWQKHGQCAGAKSMEHYFGQMCSLAEGPLEVMATSLQNGADLEGVAKELQSAGYPISYLDSRNQQIMVPACASSLAREWKIASEADFTQECGR
eukprot:TRINITY_DN81337_c0_g1_i1.p1 TRINITY_DN81337_c0_g1~~TRINITY_DN81337_c0_g1_i1.p1  ORF type:complete len:300 (+),score=37.12 TRINITY_DN81337_c0_g1_i1:37-900(+)